MLKLELTVGIRVYGAICITFDWNIVEFLNEIEFIQIGWIAKKRARLLSIALHSIGKDVLHLNWLNVRTCQNLLMWNKRTHKHIHSFNTHEKYDSITIFSGMQAIVGAQFKNWLFISISKFNKSYVYSKLKLFPSIKRLMNFSQEWIRYGNGESESNACSKRIVNFVTRRDFSRWHFIMLMAISMSAIFMTILFIWFDHFQFCAYL